LLKTLRIGFNIEEGLKNWPEDGSIVVTNMSMRYSEDKPFTLKNLSFNIHSGEKIAIVGRTGSGKSSIISCLFRMVEFKGMESPITISNQDIGKIPLSLLRKKISVILQTPLLQKGTLRMNLDPNYEHTEEKIIEALNKLEISSLFGKTFNDIIHTLKEDVVNVESNLSPGQKQLICLARSYLQKNPILILDEATSKLKKI
jgi:ABC-type multidrug transport system fused ATPase/permease subunit